MPVEVGTRGFAGHSVWRALGQLGICGKERSSAIKKITKSAELSSNWLWLNREKRDWGSKHQC